MPDAVPANSRTIVLGPGLKSCCVATIRRRTRMTVIGTHMTCQCSSQFYVDHEGMWRWVVPKPHAFLHAPYQRWTDFCVKPGCNAGPDAEVHMVTNKAISRWIYRSVRLDREKLGTWEDRYSWSDGVLGKGLKKKYKRRKGGKRSKPESIVYLGVDE